MTIAKVLEVFDILQDKYGAPYFPSEWKVDMFNMSQYEYLHDLLPEEGGEGVNFDYDSNVTATIQPLLWIVNVTMNSQGLLPTATIDTAIQTASGDATASWFRIASIGFNSGTNVYPAQYIKENNLRSFQANVFKAPSAPKNVRYNFVGNGIQFYPTAVSNTLSIKVIKNPRNVFVDENDSSNNVDPEWSDYVCYNIIAKMLKLAGVATDGQDLIQDVRLSSIAQ